MNRRISLVTAAAVAGTVLAGSAAVAANIGVLSAAEDNSIGNLSAEATVTTPTTVAETQVVDIYLEDPPATTAETTTTTGAPPDVPDVTTQEFAVEGAGAVTVDHDAAGLRVSDVDANPGWLWKTEQSSANELVVTFASSDTIYEFHASVDGNGVLDARVDQPIVNVVQVPGPASAPAPSGGSTNPAPAPATPAPAPAPSYDDDGPDDHDDEEDDEDHEDEEDEEDEDEHEGGDDDD
jgi:hypothetical protein